MSIAEFISSIAKPIYSDVDGAPFTIGQAVVVTSKSDETLDDDFIGKSGVVEYLEYECGCGQEYPHTPMIGVRFADRSIEEFWPEEIQEK